MNNKSVHVICQNKLKVLTLKYKNITMYINLSMHIAIKTLQKVKAKLIYVYMNFLSLSKYENRLLLRENNSLIYVAVISCEARGHSVMSCE